MSEEAFEKATVEGSEEASEEATEEAFEEAFEKAIEEANRQNSEFSWRHLFPRENAKNCWTSGVILMELKHSSIARLSR